MNHVQLEVRIPFCLHRCHHCSEELVTGADRQTIHAYAMALIKEIRAAEEDFSDVTVDTVCFTGGTPGLVSHDDLDEIMRAIDEVCTFSEDVEKSFQCNPSDLSADFLTVARNHGYFVYHIGAISTNTVEFKSVYRPYYYPALAGVGELEKTFRLDGINYEIVVGLPVQTEKRLQRTIEDLCSIQNDHISVYPLTLTPGSQFYDTYGEKGPIEVESYIAQAREQLLSYQYDAYTVFHYGMPGHHIKYYEKACDGMPVMGVGMGARTITEEGTWKNTMNLRTYLSFSDDLSQIAEKPVFFDDEKWEKYRNVCALMKPEGIETDSLSDWMTELLDTGVLVKTDKGVKLTDAGISQYMRIRENALK